MKQIAQNFRSGELTLQEVPAPGLLEGGVLVRNAFSLISAGTERMLIELARKSLLGKARERPDLVMHLLQKLRTEGLTAALQKASSRLDVPLPLGYSCAGMVIESACPEFSVGEWVACAGNRHAYHAEYVTVPRNLCARLPEGVTAAAAAYVALGSVALQGVRVAAPSLGERFVVIGLGLLGQLTVQILAASGCRVVGVDLDPAKAELAGQLGAERGLVRGRDAVEEWVARWTGRRGVDGVILAAATASNDPIELAGTLSRLKGRVVAVGVTKMDVPRRLYYEKELELRLSRSYGPGRYDAQYEERGHDYPYPYVRWTEQRNMEAFLDLIAAGRVNVEALTTHTYAVEDAADAYDLVTTGREPFLGVLLRYPAVVATEDPEVTEGDGKGRVLQLPVAKRPAASLFSPSKPLSVTSVSSVAKNPSGIRNRKVGLGVVGAGSFARGVLLPALARLRDVERVGLVCATGISARSAAERFGFAYCGTDFEALLADARIDAVLIATRHSLHAAMTARALRAGKAVLVEKPLAVTPEQLAEVEAARSESGGRYLVGFNRRFAPLATRAREWFAPSGRVRGARCAVRGDQSAHRAPRTAHATGGSLAPLSILVRVSAGELPAASWLREAEEGGGRRIGELCHFLDLIASLAEAPVTQVAAEGIGDETVSVVARLEDGSVGTIQYVTEGAPGLGKERVEIHGGGKSFVIEDWRVGRGMQAGRGKVWKSRGAEKGHREELAAFLAAVRDGHPMPVAEEQSVATTWATFAVVEALRRGAPCTIRAARGAKCEVRSARPGEDPTAHRAPRTAHASAASFAGHDWTNGGDGEGDACCP